MKVQNKKLLLIITYCILSYCHKTLCQSGNNIHCPDSIWFQRNDTIWTASTMPYAQVKRVYRLSKSQLKEIKIKKHLGLYEVYGITTIELLDFFDGEVALYINDSLYKKQIYKSVITDAKDKPYNSFFIEINTTKQKTGKLKIIIDNCTLASMSNSITVRFLCIK